MLYHFRAHGTRRLAFNIPGFWNQVGDQVDEHCAPIPRFLEGKLMTIVISTLRHGCDHLSMRKSQFIRVSKRGRWIYIKLCMELIMWPVRHYFTQLWIIDDLTPAQTSVNTYCLFFFVEKKRIEIFVCKTAVIFYWSPCIKFLSLSDTRLQTTSMPEPT